MMESPNPGGPPVLHGSDPRPSLGFPVGTALLLLVIFTLSGIFSCCYHWDKLRRNQSLRAASAADEVDFRPSKPIPLHMDLKDNEKQSLPVIMPGDNVPKFIALPCPCEPPRRREVIVEVQEPPPKPPPQRIAGPLYQLLLDSNL